MALWQGRSKRKPSGGRLRPNRLKKRFEIGRETELTFTAPPRFRVVRTMGDHTKIKTLSTNTAIVTNKKTKRSQKTKIIQVVENKANPHYVRRNIITKGAIIQTEAGNAVVTSRPGQHGVVNAVLLEG